MEKQLSGEFDGSDSFDLLKKIREIFNLSITSLVSCFLYSRGDKDILVSQLKRGNYFRLIKRHLLRRKFINNYLRGVFCELNLLLGVNNDKLFNVSYLNKGFGLAAIFGNKHYHELLNSTFAGLLDAKSSEVFLDRKIYADKTLYHETLHYYHGLYNDSMIRISKLFDGLLSDENFSNIRYEGFKSALHMAISYRISTEFVSEIFSFVKYGIYNPTCTLSLPHGIIESLQSQENLETFAKVWSFDLEPDIIEKKSIDNSVKRIDLVLNMILPLICSKPDNVRIVGKIDDNSNELVSFGYEGIEYLDADMLQSMIKEFFFMDVKDLVKVIDSYVLKFNTLLMDGINGYAKSNISK